ncbi:S8 family serine peptidase [Cnuibacter physcomitrellae]|uniref:S8 family serine peptidase n=1 Tax=Cnuibacter physcomitrellae TaxID=1619308 RepID=UPI0021759D57|nr:S8 family serine peptidase [Cnuibacter physcomitrellae]MCS5498093.1 S8 family serine peptidase [Cnuibacter physcomitrellae]
MTQLKRFVVAGALAAGCVLATAVPAHAENVPPEWSQAATATPGDAIAAPASADPASAAPASDAAPAADAESASACSPSIASAALGADEARTLFGVDGTGVKVGIISNSFDTGVEPTASDDAVSGALPGPGNPCGYTTPVTVVLESERPQDDEGRAMAQVVHGIAPGAALYFAASGASGSAGIAHAIELLVAQGVDVIVDDIQGEDERVLQRSAAGAAIQAAVDAGVAYVTASGNWTVLGAEGYPSAGYPIGGWSAPRYEPTACSDAVAALYPGQDVDCLDFDPGSAGDPTMRVTLPANGAMAGQLGWAEPDGAVLTHLDYVLAFADGTTRVVPAPDASSAFIAAGLYNPDEDAAADVEVSIVRTNPDTAGTPAVQWVLQKLLIPGGSARMLLDLEHFRSGGDVSIGASMLGHSAEPSAIRVAAVDSTSLQLETFSSGGPALTALGVSEPITVPGPTVAGADAIPISFVLGSGAVFRGTSAAAPSIAGVLALALQYAPDTGVADLTAALTASARPDGYTSTLPADVDRARFAGAGLADATALLSALGPAPSPAPVPVPVPVPAPSPDAAGVRPTALAATGAGGSAPYGLLAAVLLGAGVLALRSLRRARARAR